MTRLSQGGKQQVHSEEEQLSQSVTERASWLDRAAESMLEKTKGKQNTRPVLSSRRHLEKGALSTCRFQSTPYDNSKNIIKDFT